MPLGEIIVDNDEFKPLRYRKRWFCYLDLLGFTALVNDNNISHVIPIYQGVLKKLSATAEAVPIKGITYTWFSDTFIIYSRSDSEKDFARVESIGRRFFQELILNKIAVRGAVTHGALYSQSSKNIFVGPALIDAYHYAEAQDWLGFILKPSVFNRLKASSIPLHVRAHYREIARLDIVKNNLAGPINAFAFNNATLNGKNPYVEALLQLKTLAPEKDKPKYEKAIGFANEHWHPHRA